MIKCEAGEIVVSTKGKTQILYYPHFIIVSDEEERFILLMR